MKVLILNGSENIAKLHVKKLAEGVYFIYIKVKPPAMKTLKYIEKGPEHDIINVFDEVTIAVPAKTLVIEGSAITNEVELIAIDRKLLYKLYKEARGAESGA